MRVQHFHESADGGSKFSDIEIALPLTREDNFGHTLNMSAPFASSSVCIVELPRGLDQDWHGAPQRQLVVVLDGTVEVETTDGEIRRWSNGECFIANDTTGQGHRTRTIDGPAHVLFVPIDGPLQLDQWARSATTD